MRPLQARISDESMRGWRSLADEGPSLTSIVEVLGLMVGEGQKRIEIAELLKRARSVTAERRHPPP